MNSYLKNNNNINSRKKKYNNKSKEGKRLITVDKLIVLHITSISLSLWNSAAGAYESVLCTGDGTIHMEVYMIFVSHFFISFFVGLLPRTKSKHY